VKARTTTPLRLAREALGLTIREVRQATGISVGRLSMMERLMVEPSPLEMERLALVLNASARELFPPDGSLRVA
jgi:transcriptional regulator with XRE-family HTH domain